MFTGATAFNVSTIASCLLGDVPEDWTTTQEVNRVPSASAVASCQWLRTSVFCGMAAEGCQYVPASVHAPVLVPADAPSY